MMLNLKGTIKSSKKVFWDEQECYGLTKLENKTFSVRLSEQTIQDQVFSETLLHEFLHLWLAILFQVHLGKVVITEAEQHEVIDPIVSFGLNKLHNSLKKYE